MWHCLISPISHLVRINSQLFSNLNKQLSNVFLMDSSKRLFWYIEIFLYIICLHLTKKSLDDQIDFSFKSEWQKKYLTLFFKFEFFRILREEKLISCFFGLMIVLSFGWRCFVPTLKISRKIQKFWAAKRQQASWLVQTQDPRDSSLSTHTLVSVFSNCRFFLFLLWVFGFRCRFEPLDVSFLKIPSLSPDFSFSFRASKHQTGQKHPPSDFPILLENPNTFLRPIPFSIKSHTLTDIKYQFSNY